MTPAPQEQVLFFKIASNYRVNMKLTIQLSKKFLVVHLNLLVYT